MMLFMIDGFLEWEIRLFKDYCLWKEVLFLYCKDTPFSTSRQIVRDTHQVYAR